MGTAAAVPTVAGVGAALPGVMTAGLPTVEADATVEGAGVALDPDETVGEPTADADATTVAGTVETTVAE